MGIPTKSVAWTKGNFVTVPNKDLIYKMSASQLKIYFALCDYADNEGQCWPSYDTLANKTTVSRRKTIDAVKSLVDMGVLHVIKKRKSNNDNEVNRYQIMQIPSDHLVSDLVTPESLPSDATVTTPSDASVTQTNPVLTNPIELPSLRKGASTSNTKVLEIKSKKTKSYGNNDVNQVMDKFKSDIGKMLNIKKQRIAATNLIRSYGLERVLSSIDTVVTLRGENYTPVISDLQDLYAKWTALETALMRRNNPPNSVTIPKINQALHKRIPIEQPEISPEERQRETKALAARRAENKIKYAPRRIILV